MESVVKFFKEVRLELSRVEWPKRDEFTGATTVVLVVVALFSIFLLFVDRSIVVVLSRIFGVGGL